MVEEFQIGLSNRGGPDFAWLGFDWSFHQLGFDLTLPFRFAKQPVAKRHERRIVGAAGTVFQIPGFLFCGDDRERRDQPAGCQCVGDVQRLRRRNAAAAWRLPAIPMVS